MGVRERSSCDFAGKTKASIDLESDASFSLLLLRQTSHMLGPPPERRAIWAIARGKRRRRRRSKKERIRNGV